MSFLFDESAFPLEKHKNFKDDYFFWFKEFVKSKTLSLSKRLVFNEKEVANIIDKINIEDNIYSIKEHSNALSRLGFKGLKTYVNPLIEFYDFMIKSNASKITQINHKALEYFLTKEVNTYIAIRNNKEVELQTSPTTIKNKLVAIKSFLIYMENNSYDEDRDFRFKIKKDISSVIPKEKKEKKFLDPKSQYQEFEKAIETAKYDKKIAARNRLLLKIYFYTGIRTIEALTLKNEDMHLDSKEEYLSFIIVGKGNKQHRKALPYDYVKKDFLEWMKIKDELNLNTSLLFCTAKGKRLVETYAYKLTRALLESIGMGEGGKLGAHTIRRSLITKKIDEGYDISQVQDFIGHEDISTTRRYVSITNDKIKEMSKKKGD